MSVVSIYGLVNPRTDEIFYIGYAYDMKKRYSEHLRIKNKNTYKDRVINKIIACGLKPEIFIIDTCEKYYIEGVKKFEHELLEIYYIQMYRNSGVKLTNLTDGGNGGRINTSIKKVFQYSENGEFIKEFNSVNDTGDYFGIGPSLISKVIDQRAKKSFHGTYLFSSHEKANRFIFKKTIKQNRVIVQYSLDGKQINEFNNQQVAEKTTKIFQSNMNRCLNGTRKSAGGFIWKYKTINIKQYE